MMHLRVIEAARKIGRFYLAKHNNDYAAAEKELNALQISRIEVTNTETFSSLVRSQSPPQTIISITTARPGILIGKRGQNIDNLAKYLGTKVHIVEDEEPLYQYLVPNQAYDREDMWELP